MVSLRFAYVYWKVLGLCPFVFADDDAVRVSHGGLIYAIILTAIYTGCYARVVANRTTLTLPRETPISIIADFSGLSVEFALIVLSWLCFGFRQKRAQKIQLFFKRIHKTYDDLGIYDSGDAKLLKKVKIHTVVINFIWYFLCLADHLLLLNNAAFKLTIWMPFNLPRVVSHNIIVMFTNAMKVIQQRFSLLNERIRELPKEVSTRVITRRRSSRQDTNSGFKSFVIPGPLETYGRIHSDLIYLAKVVAEFYSLSLLFIMLTHFIQMSSGLYTTCLFAKDRTNWPWRDLGSFLVLVAWFVLNFTEMAILLSVSDSITKEANQAGDVLHKMILDDRADRYMDSAKILSLQLLQRQLSIDLFGMLQMKLSMIYRVMGMVTTYITIMVQLDGQETGN